MTATATTTAPPSHDRRSWHGAGVGVQVLVLTARSLRPLMKDPATIVFNLVQPLFMLVLFSQVFGKAMTGTVAAQGGNYINYLMPAMLVTTGIGAALQAGLTLITDLRSGMLSRLRAMPIRQGSVLFGRATAYLLRTFVQLIVLLVAGTLLFGFSPAGGLFGTLGAVLLALLVSWTLSWLFLAIAAWVRRLEVMQGLGFFAMYPLMFASSAFVPAGSLSAWLRVIAVVNPLTYAVNASRGLALALPAGGAVLAALATNALFCSAAIAIAIKGFRRPL